VLWNYRKILLAPPIKSLSQMKRKRNRGVAGCYLIEREQSLLARAVWPLALS
jgi:hypothetical protein